MAVTNAMLAVTLSERLDGPLAPILVLVSFLTIAIVGILSLREGSAGRERTE